MTIYAMWSWSQPCPITTATAAHPPWRWVGGAAGVIIETPFARPNLPGAAHRFGRSAQLVSPSRGWCTRIKGQIILSFDGVWPRFATIVVLLVLRYGREECHT
jgi:hypothetical protein